MKHYYIRMKPKICAVTKDMELDREFIDKWQLTETVWWRFYLVRWFNIYYDSKQSIQDEA